MSELTGTATPVVNWGGGREGKGGAPGSRVCTGVWSHPPPENFEI